MKGLLTGLITVFSFLYVIVLPAQNNVGPGNAIDLDGLNDKVNLGASFNSLSLPVTICAWVNPASSSLILPIFQSCADLSNWYGVFLTVDNGRLQASVGGGSGGFTINGRNTLYVPVSQFFGEWYHIAAVINGANNMKIYVNGIEMSGTYQGTATSMSNTANGQAYIGFHQKNFQRHYEGQIDELSVWDVALSQNQVRDLMCKKINPSASNLLAAWDFNDPLTSNTVTDISGNGINGTKTGGIGHVLSGAPVGDVADHFHQSASFNNTNQSFTLQGQQIDVSQMTSPASGVHVYKVNAIPSISTGITSCADSVYYGVFLAKTNLAQTPTFQVGLPGKTIAFEREKNDDLTWSVFIPNSTVNDRREFVAGLNVQASLGNDTTLCAGDSIQVAFPPGGTYLWSDGSSQSSNYLVAGDTLWGTATVNGCIFQDTIIATAISGAIDLINDTTGCQVPEVVIEVPAGYTVTWDDGTTSAPRTITQTGQYWGEFTTGSCTFTDSFYVALVNIPSPTPLNTTLCSGDSVLVAMPPGYDYLWQDGRTDQQRYIAAGNNVWVKTSDGTCHRQDTIRVNEIATGDMSVLPSDTLICAGEAVYVGLPAWVSQIMWSDGDTSRYRALSEAGLWYWWGQSPCGAIGDSMIMVVDDCTEKPLYVPNAFTPNGDNRNDVFLVKGFEGSRFNIKIFNRWGNLTFESQNPYFTWDGSYQGRACSEGVYMYVINYLNRFDQYRTLNGTLTLIR